MSHCDIRVLDRLGHSVSLIRAERTRSAFLSYGWTFRKLNFRANSTHLSYNQKGRYFQKYFDNNESIQGKDGMNWKK